MLKNVSYILFSIIVLSTVILSSCDNYKESYLASDSKINNKNVPYFYYEIVGEETEWYDNNNVIELKKSYKYDEENMVYYKDYLNGIEIVKCNSLNKNVTIPKSIEGKDVIKFYGYIDKEYLEEDLDYSLRSCFDTNTKFKVINIPLTIKEIVKGTFDVETLERIEVDKNNPYYSSKDGILYDKSGKIRLCVPPNHHSRNKD